MNNNYFTNDFLIKTLNNIKNGFKFGFFGLLVFGVLAGGVVGFADETYNLDQIIPAENKSDIDCVYINEFSFESGNEWVELYNACDDDIDLDGWVLGLHESWDNGHQINQHIDLYGKILKGDFRVFGMKEGNWNSNYLNKNGDSIILYSELDRGSFNDEEYNNYKIVNKIKYTYNPFTPDEEATGNYSLARKTDGSKTWVKRVGDEEVTRGSSNNLDAQDEEEEDSTDDGSSGGGDAGKDPETDPEDGNQDDSGDSDTPPEDESNDDENDPEKENENEENEKEDNQKDKDKPENDPENDEDSETDQDQDPENEPEQDEDKPETEGVKDEKTEKPKEEKQETEAAQTDFFIEFEDPISCGQPLTASINSSQEIDFARLEIANFERDFVNTGNPNRLEIVNYFSGFEGIPFGKNQVTLTAYLSNQEVYQDVYTLDFDFSDCYTTRDLLVRTGGFDN